MSVQATLYHGNLPIIIAGPTPSRGPRGSLDSLTLEILTGRTTWEEDVVSLGYQYEQRVPGYPGLWVQTIDPEPENDIISLVKVQCIGLLYGGEKRKRRLSVAGREIAVGPNEEIVLVWRRDEQAEETDGTPIDHLHRPVGKLYASGEKVGQTIYKTITVPGATGTRFNVRDAILVVSDTYFTTTEPDTTVIGAAFTPPNAPQTPAYIWGDYTEALRGNYPHGWVLDDRQVEEHFRSGGEGLWEVTDVVGFYQIAVAD